MDKYQGSRLLLGADQRERQMPLAPHSKQPGGTTARNTETGRLSPSAVTKDKEQLPNPDLKHRLHSDSLQLKPPNGNDNDCTVISS